MCTVAEERVGPANGASERVASNERVGGYLKASRIGNVACRRTKH